MSKRMFVFIAILAAVAACIVVTPAGIAGLTIHEAASVHAEQPQPLPTVIGDSQNITMSVGTFRAILHEQNRHDETMMQNIKDVSTIGAITQATTNATHDLTMLVVFLIAFVGVVLIVGIMILGKGQGVKP